MAKHYYEDGKEVRYRVNTSEMVVFMFLAIVADIISLIPAVNIVWAIVVELIFTGVFFLNGINMWWGGRKSGNKMFTSITASIVELIPAVSWLTGYTAQVGYTIYVSRKEDRITPPKTTGPSLLGYAGMAIPGPIGGMWAAGMVAKTAVKTKSMPKMTPTLGAKMPMVAKTYSTITKTGSLVADNKQSPENSVPIPKKDFSNDSVQNVISHEPPIENTSITEKGNTAPTPSHTNTPAKTSQNTSTSRGSSK